MVVAFAIGLAASMGGASGAFLLLPYQVTFLGLAGPAASATNLLYNILAIPAGVHRYARENRIVWPLVRVLVLSCLPGMVLGAVLRVFVLPGGAAFRLFMGAVLLLVAVPLLADVFLHKGRGSAETDGTGFRVEGARIEGGCVRYGFRGGEWTLCVWKLSVLSLVLGVLGGAYGIGGGAVLAPLLIGVYRLPAHSIAGSTLCVTWISSVLGVIGYVVLSLVHPGSDTRIAPDWVLGAMLSIGGLGGIYLGSRMQRHVPGRVIRVLLAALTVFAGVRYLVEGVRGLSGG